MAGEDHKLNLHRQNIVAQLQETKRELAEVTAALSEAANRHSVLLGENEAIRAESAELLSEAVRTVEDAKTFHSGAKTKYDNMVAEEMAWQEKKRISDEEVARNETNSRHVLQEHDILKSNNKDILAAQNKQIDDAGAAYKDICDKVVEATLTLTDIHGKISEHTSTHNNNVRTATEELAKSAREKESAESDLRSILAQIEVERERIGAPLKSLQERESQLAQKERDLDIYEARVRSHHKMTFPDREIKL